MVKKDNDVYQKYIGENFKEFSLDGKLKFRYAISNFGRMISFSENFEDGRIIKGSITEGYKLLRYKIRVGEKISYRHKFFHRLVAEQFLPKTSDDQIYVIHLDHNLANNLVSNLKWVTKKEMKQHQNTNPKVLKARVYTIKNLQKHNKAKEGFKLNSTKVMLIKKLLAKPDRTTRMKMIARQFNISEMHLYRIKTGQNWSHVKI